IAGKSASARSRGLAPHGWWTNTSRSTSASWRPGVASSEPLPAASGAARPLPGRTVLGIFAHPDDESLACGGTLARLADAGARVIVMCASQGEAGSLCDPSLVPEGESRACGRVRELNDAAAVLGVSEVIILDHPDGDLRWS